MVDTDDTRRTTDDGRRTTPWVWHKLPTGELKNGKCVFYCNVQCSPVNLSKHNIYTLFRRLKQFFSCLHRSKFYASFCYLVELPIYAFSLAIF